MTQTHSDERADFGHPSTGIVVYGGPQVRSVAAALEDFTAGIKHYGYWHNLAWNDIKTRYRRSLLGEFWMTVNWRFSLLRWARSTPYCSMRGYPTTCRD